MRVRIHRCSWRQCVHKHQNESILIACPAHLALGVQHGGVSVLAGVGDLGHVLQLPRLLLHLGRQEDGRCRHILRGGRRREGTEEGRGTREGGEKQELIFVLRHSYKRKAGNQSGLIQNPILENVSLKPTHPHKQKKRKKKEAFECEWECEVRS